MLRNMVIGIARKVLSVVDDSNTDPGPRMAAEDRLRVMVEKYTIKPHEVGAIPTHRIWQPYQEAYGLEPIAEEPRSDGEIRYDSEGNAICPSCGNRMKWSGAYGAQCTVCKLYHSFDPVAEAEYNASCDRCADKNREKEAAERGMVKAEPKLNDTHCLACRLSYAVTEDDGDRYPYCRLTEAKLDELRGCDQFVRGVFFDQGEGD